jgi:hypothetical protein
VTLEHWPAMFGWALCVDNVSVDTSSWPRGWTFDQWTTELYIYLEWELQSFALAEMTDIYQGRKHFSFHFSHLIPIFLNGLYPYSIHQFIKAQYCFKMEVKPRNFGTFLAGFLLTAPTKQ